MKRTVTIATVAAAAVFCLAPPAAAAPPEADAGRLRALFQSGQVDEAERQALAALESSPDDVDVKVVLANVYRKRALDTAAAAPRTDEFGLPAPIPSEGGAPVTEPASELFAKATAQLREALETAPDRRDIWLGLCQMEREAGNVEGLVEATAEAAAAIPDDADFAAALRDNARSFIVRQDYDAGGRILAAIARHNTTDIPSLLGAGRAEYFAGRTEEGTGLIDRAVLLRPSDPEVHYQRGEIAAFEQDFRLAANHFGRAASLERANPKASLALITALHSHTPSEALRIARRLVNLWTAEPTTATNALVVVLVKELKRVLEKRPPSALDLLRTAQNIGRTDYHSATLGEVAAVLSVDRGMAEALILQAETYGRLGLHGRVIATLEQALDLMDKQPTRTFGITRDEVLGAIGTEHLRAGDDAGALEAYDKMSAVGDHAFQMALANHRLGRHAEAGRLFREVLVSGQDPLQIDQARRYLATPPYQTAP